MTDEEINTAVAEKIYRRVKGGWQINHSSGHDWHRDLPVINYANDIKEAWSLIDKFPEVVIDKIGEEMWTVRSFIDKDLKILGKANTAPLAICLAFLNLP